MKSLFFWTDAVAMHGRIAWSLNPDVKTPWVATDDIADLAARELMNPTGRHRVIRQLGADYTMSEIAVIVGREIGRPVEYRFIDQARSDVQAEFVLSFGALERWPDDCQTVEPPRGDPGKMSVHGWPGWG